MLNYPLNFSFKIVVFNPQVIIKDSTGKTVFYVKQKALALKESVKIFEDEAQSKELFNIKANKVIDFSAQYNISNTQGTNFGMIQRQGMKSIWKATYNIFDATGGEKGVIHEENPWLKILDAFLSQIPFLSMLVNPSYLVDMNGKTVFKLKKQPAVFEGKFLLEKTAEINESDENLIIQSLIMMILLERTRG
jgi:uncharacterized protein YxjI